jgi:uncharacterized protein YuzE
MAIRLHPHARERLAERGATEAEVVATVSQGGTFPAKLERNGIPPQLPVWCEVARTVLCKQAGDCFRSPRTARLAGDHCDYEIFLIMKLTYDPRYNIAYIRLLEKKAQVETLQISDELNIDLAPDGRVYGIELLNANKQLRAQDGGRLVVRNEADGEELELPLAAS